MCGVAGFISFESCCHFDEQLMKMADAVSHRGPDDYGVWFDKKDGVGFSHRRLSIIDLTPTGKQPMTSHSGRYVISYNGEVYNYPEIKKELGEHDIRWQGTSDTEVMLAAIDTWGIKASVEKFNGMFAFALWDKKDKILTLCRDRVGIKPLYFARVQNGLLFGSELKSIMAHSLFEARINHDAIGAYLKYCYIPAPDTIFKQTWKLKPGHMFQIGLSDVINGNIPLQTCYWDIENIAVQNQEQALSCSDSDAIEMLDALLADSVKKRMISDVPVGAFLSGGIDSSTVVSVMQAQCAQKINTFSIGFNEVGYDEAVYAKKVARHLSTNHTELYLDTADAVNLIPKLPCFYDEPFSDSSQIPTFLVSQLARQQVTVSLSGDGGDELFGGYNRHFLIPLIWKKIGWLSADVRKSLLEKFAQISPVFLNDLFYRINRLLPDYRKINRAGDKLVKLLDIIDLKNPEAIYDALCSTWRHPEQVLADKRCPLFDDIRKNSDLDTISHQTMLWDTTTYLPDDILTKVDRATMAVSLEGRVPILDHRIVEFAWQLPEKMKIRKNKGKWILRKVLEKYLPIRLVDRPKAGFGIPVDSWLRNDLKDWAENLLDRKRLESDGFFDPDTIRRVWHQHQNKKENRQYQLWNILMFQAWLDEYKK